jgi:hypothetical protein
MDKPIKTPVISKKVKRKKADTDSNNKERNLFCPPWNEPTKELPSKTVEEASAFLGSIRHQEHGKEFFGRG